MWSDHLHAGCKAQIFCWNLQILEGNVEFYLQILYETSFD